VTDVVRAEQGHHHDLRTLLADWLDARCYVFIDRRHRVLTPTPAGAFVLCRVLLAQHGGKRRSGELCHQSSGRAVHRLLVVMAATIVSVDSSLLTHSSSLILATMFTCRVYPPNANAKDCGDYPLLSTCHSEDESEDVLSSWPSTSPGRSRRAASLGGVGVGASSSPGDADAQAFATPLGTWSVGKVSVLLLAFATIVDFALCHVQSMEHPEFYDALSADVIRPAFRYHHSSTSGPSRPRRTSLGSAAISSVTEALSPILPFAGGLDLRKQDYWVSSGNFFETLQGVAATVQEAFRSKSSWSSSLTSVVDSPRGGGNVPGKLASQLKRKPTQHITAISSADPFVSLTTISEMTLSDVTETFRYAVECNKEAFNEARFVNNVAPRVRTVVTAVSEAMAKSRGRDAKISQSAGTPTGAGEVDALAFSAAMRIFAEWRMLRQVPEGYKGFAMGMSLGHKDVVQNLAKIEQGAHEWLNRQRDVLALQAQWDGSGEADKCPIDGSSSPQVLRSPTLKEILGYEIEMDINPASRLPRLKDKSASMGVLWVRRQLHYQTLLFDNAMKIPSKFSSTAEAVMAAYKSVYDKYHGWAVQKIFNYSFQAAPEAEEIFKHMNPHKFKEVVASVHKVQSSSNPTDGQNHLSQEPDENPFTSFFKHVGGEWDKLVANVGQVFGQGKDSAAELMVRGGSSGAAASAFNKESDALVTKEMVKDAHEHISNYLKVVYPLLDDLAILFDDMNMDDPTRV
jgi:Glycolipid transfer protein (GLTP)